MTIGQVFSLKKANILWKHQVKSQINFVQNENMNDESEFQVHFQSTDHYNLMIFMRSDDQWK